MSASVLSRLTFDEPSHTYRVDGAVWPSVTQVLERVGLTDFSSIPEPYREAALSRGRRVHKAAHYLSEGTLDWSTVDNAERGYVNACANFLAHSGFVMLAQERRIAHHTYRYAGTADGVGLWNGSFALVDWCTGDLWESAKDLQTAAYAEALRLNPPEEWWGFMPSTPILRLGVHLKKSGLYTAEPFANPRDFAVFVDAVTIAHEQLRRGVRGRGRKAA